MKNINKAFTLVELLVVITILAILGAIAFISLQGYSKTARDSRRISDISNIKTALELFILRTGNYPLPDNGQEVSYSGDTLRTQGTIGDNVTTNLSKILQSKPLDPLLDIEYVYSATHNKKEYQVMTLYEGELSNAYNLINTSFATNIYKTKVEGTYNEVFIKTLTYIVPVPSIINSEVSGTGIVLNADNILSQIVTGGTNFPDLRIPNATLQTGSLDNMLFLPVLTITSTSLKSQKESVIIAIQDAYELTDLAAQYLYANILNTTEPEILADQLILNVYNTVAVLTSKTVSDCGTTTGEVIYGTDDGLADGTDLLTCDDDIIVCNGTIGSGYTITACNVGSNNVSTNFDDINGFGGIFQWGNNYNLRGNQFTNGDIYPTTSTTKILATTDNSTYSNNVFILGNSDWTSIKNDNLWGDNSGAGTNEQRKGPCITGYHVPTGSEWIGIHTAGQWGNNGVDSGLNMSNALKMPMAGVREPVNANLNLKGVVGLYWSSTPYYTYIYDMYISFSNNINPSSSNNRDYGASVRCFKN